MPRKPLNRRPNPIFNSGRIAAKSGLQHEDNPYDVAADDQRERNFAARWLEGFDSYEQEKKEGEDHA